MRETILPFTGVAAELIEMTAQVTEFCGTLDGNCARISGIAQLCRDGGLPDGDSGRAGTIPLDRSINWLRERESGPSRYSRRIAVLMQCSLAIAPLANGRAPDGLVCRNAHHRSAAASVCRYCENLGKIARFTRYQTNLRKFLL